MRSGFHNLLGGGFRAAISLVTVIVLTRLIGVEEYGLWTLVNAVIAIAGLAEGGVSVATTLFASKDLANEDKRALGTTLTISGGLLLLTASFASGILWLATDWLASLLPGLEEGHKEIAKGALKIGAVVIWMRLVLNFFLGVEQALEIYGKMNVFLTAQSVLLNAGMLVIAKRGGGTLDLMAWHALIGAFSLMPHALLILSSMRGWNLAMGWDKTKAIAIAKCSGLNWLSVLATTAFGQCDRLIVGGFLNTSAAGIYGLITTISAQINILSSLTVQPLMPKASKQSGKTNDSNFETSVEAATRLNAVIAFGMAILLIGFAETFLTLVLKHSPTTEVLLAFRIAVIIYSLYSLNAIGYYLLLGMGEIRTCLAYVLLFGFSSLILIACGAQFKGLIGALAGNAGYLGTIGLTFMALTRLNILRSVWRHALLLPFCWFLIAIGVLLILPEWAAVKSTLSLAALACLSFWFFKAQKSLKNHP